MRAVWIMGAGGTEVLQVRETPDPRPGPGEVRVRVRAAGLNFAEVMARQGLYPDMPKVPCVVGYEASGVVDQAGEGVRLPRRGAKVIVLARFGAHADTICAPAPQTFPMPRGMTFEEAAALPVNYLTAYHMLFRVGNLRPNQRVLVHMAAGGVGLAVLQLCRTIPGVEVFGTASASKHHVLRNEGCRSPIDYHTRDYVEEVLRYTKGEGVDLVLDPLGGKDWKRGYRLLRPLGRLVAFGMANMAAGDRRHLLHMARQALSIPLFTPVGLMKDNRSVAGVNMGHLWMETELLAEAMRAVLDLYRKGVVRPHIDSVFPFPRAGEAHRRIEERRNVGKVILVP